VDNTASFVGAIVSYAIVCLCVSHKPACCTTCHAYGVCLITENPWGCVLLLPTRPPTGRDVTALLIDPTTQPHLHQACTHRRGIHYPSDCQHSSHTIVLLERPILPPRIFLVHFHPHHQLVCFLSFEIQHLRLLVFRSRTSPVHDLLAIPRTYIYTNKHV